MPAPAPGDDTGSQPFPGGNPGGNTGGGVAGKLKTKVSPFFAGAFDPEKKELIVVLGRPSGTKPAGVIQRYSVPDFKLVGTTHHIPSVATRAVIDPKKELLYVTTVNGSPLQALMQNQFDRGSFAGDVAVYDLAAIRSGKVPERGEVKPVGSFNIASGRSVRDIVLSDDGKTLFALAVPTSPKTKSQISAFDTSTRKVIKVGDLPDPAWRMVASGDGKKLLVSGTPPAAGAQNPLIMVVDQAGLGLLPSTASPNPKGAVFDIAVAKDGMVVTCSAGGPSSPNYELYTIDAEKSSNASLPPGVTSVSNNGYVAVTPNGKHLIVSSHHPGQTSTGLDVYELNDKLTVDKKVASMKQAGDTPVGGTFLVSPDSDFIVFTNGAVLKLDDLGGSSASAATSVGGMPPRVAPPGMPVQGGMPMPVKPSSAPDGMPMGSPPAGTPMGSPPAGMPVKPSSAPAGMPMGSPPAGMPMGSPPVKTP